MMGLPFAFAAPAVLGALIVLPVIWWLLRLTPPRPRTEEFPPTRLLLEISKKDETPARSPWWLTALRLLLAGVLIFALAGPIFRPVAEEAPGTGPLLVVIDNGWASAPRWDGIRDTARRIIDLAANEDRPVALVASAEGANQAMEATDPGVALSRLEALEPRPLPNDRAGLTTALATIAGDTRFGGVAWLTDGLGGEDTAAFATFLNQAVAAPVMVYGDDSAEILGLAPPVGASTGLTAAVVRRPSAAIAAGAVAARDIQGRVIGEATFEFPAGVNTAEAAFSDLPTELRNEIVRIEIVAGGTAGGVQLLDERWRRRTVGLLSGTSAENSQPLLSPLYYITRALQPFADLREPRDPNISVSVPELIDSGVSAIVMADIGSLPEDVETRLSEWIDGGGTLIRFAGPRLAASADDLIPVELRQGGRTLGGSLSWETPQPLATFSDDSPFAGITVPADVLVERQVLAEPTAELADYVWASLTDGTPLVTAANVGDGRIVLFHVTADPAWSNLPISGAFVEMLRRVVATSQAVRATAEEGDAPSVLPPYRLLDGYGRFTAPGTSAQPITAGPAEVVVDARHPPGLYGAEDGFRAVNLLPEGTELLPFNAALLDGAQLRAYPTSSPLQLAPWLLALALALLILDALAVLWLGGAFRGRRRAPAAAAALLAIMVGFAAAPPPAAAQDQAQRDADLRAIEATSNTVLAYVLTGNPDIDETSRAGLMGLSRVLADRTALEPGDPVGIDVAVDELSFYPLLYWPVDPESPMPASATIGRIDAYMRNGGSILFDTRDQLAQSTLGEGFGGTPAADRLRTMLASLDLPTLEPVPTDHVLTKAFYLLSEFPGRYAAGALWVEALPEADEFAEERPARAGDGVSPILITSNDLAAAWAMDAAGNYLHPTVPNSPLQREFAFRTGVNILMYMLTGNYKADQVHVPALLERLGQ